MSFEQPPKNEKPKPIAQRLERGELTEAEKKQALPIFERFARLGLPLQFHSPDPRDQVELEDILDWLNVAANIFEEDLSRAEHNRGLEQMTSSERERYLELRMQSRDELAMIGLTPEDVDAMLPDLDVNALDDKELEEVLSRNDYERARMLLKNGMIDPFDQTPLPKKDQKDEYLAKIFDLEQKFKESRHAFQEANKLQNKHGRWLDVSTEMGKEYLARVKKELGA